MSFKQLIINIDSESAEQLSEIFFDLAHTQNSFPKK
jgi:hypothetical protein